MVYNLPPLEEPQQHGGWLAAFARTWFEACLSPVKFFDAVGRGTSLFEPVLFGVIVGWLSAIATSLMSFMGIVPLVGFLRFGWLLLFGWLFALVGIMVSTLVAHLFLIIVGGARRGLATTCRVIGYAWAPNIFSIVPVIGWLVAPIYGIVLEIIGLARAHGIEYWRSAIAVILPILLGCCCVIATVGYFFVAFIAEAVSTPK
ncbi:MAG: hypothetical protein GDYSWBUE_000663 [Candidatus Fervidibacterota bacterium]